MLAAAVRSVASTSASASTLFRVLTRAANRNNGMHDAIWVLTELAVDEGSADWAKVD
jgi:hypothetical protein